MGAAALVLVHGLWMRPWVMRPLGWRLRRAGFVCHFFAYDSVREPLATALARLHRAIDDMDAPVGVLGHSLGGRLAAAVDHPRVVRALALCTPLRASRAACALAARPWGRRLGGEGLRALLDPAPPAPAGLSVAALAGTAGHGLGRLLADLPRPHDGTVAVDETRAPWLADHGCLPISHSTALTSGAVARAAAHFFRHGTLPRPPVTPLSGLIPRPR